MSTAVPINKAINPAQLDVELVAAFPALREPAGEFFITHYTLDHITDTSWVLHVPDEIVGPELDAVIANHDPSIQTDEQQAEDVDRSHIQALRDQYQTLKGGLDTIRTHQNDVRDHMDQIQAMPNPSTANLASLTAVANAVKQVSQDLEQVSGDITMMTQGLDRLLDTLATITKRLVASPGT